MSLRRVKILRPLSLGGVNRAVGDTVETDENAAANLVRKGWVEMATEPIPVVEFKPEKLKTKK